MIVLKTDLFRSSIQITRRSTMGQPPLSTDPLPNILTAPYFLVKALNRSRISRS